MGAAAESHMPVSSSVNCNMRSITRVVVLIAESDLLSDLISDNFRHTSFNIVEPYVYYYNFSVSFRLYQRIYMERLLVMYLVLINLVWSYFSWNRRLRDRVGQIYPNLVSLCLIPDCRHLPLWSMHGSTMCLLLSIDKQNYKSVIEFHVIIIDNICRQVETYLSLAFVTEQQYRT